MLRDVSPDGAPFSPGSSIPQIIPDDVHFFRYRIVFTIESLQGLLGHVWSVLTQKEHWSLWGADAGDQCGQRHQRSEHCDLVPAERVAERVD